MYMLQKCIKFYLNNISFCSYSSVYVDFILILELFFLFLVRTQQYMFSICVILGFSISSKQWMSYLSWILDNIIFTAEILLTKLLIDRLKA